MRRTPPLSSRSADLLVQEGFLYDSSLMSDSRPFVIQAGGGELIELPIDGTMSDWPHYAHVPDLGYLMSPKSPAAAIEVFRAEFDAAYELGGLWITIWHPHVSGRPARMLAWAKLIEYMLEPRRRLVRDARRDRAPRTLLHRRGHVRAAHRVAALLRVGPARVRAARAARLGRPSGGMQ